jgi:hypothetical protein
MDARAFSVPDSTKRPISDFWPPPFRSPWPAQGRTHLGQYFRISVEIHQMFDLGQLRVLFIFISRL